ncbi:alpha/beta hydrolase family protein [Zhouia sp. PK063]|uniref:alpha/beta hydrolase family protein n=1 Tax=Zhouia sp. PK063 TaxID=3373602 RepID=UPI0037B83DEF
MTTRNIVLEGKHNKPILLDIFQNETQKPQPIIIFAHGYKGFKDWGHWDSIAEQFAENGFCFIKFNFSHNGGTVQNPIDFPDPEAFAQNNFSIELDDLKSVIDWVCSDSFSFNGDMNNISLIGHSRGGGIVLIKTAEDTRIKNVITWASVADFGARFADENAVAYWKANGVIYIENSRTKQQLPHYYQFYEDFKANEERLTIKNAVQKIKVPMLIIHGSADETVQLKEGKALHEWNPKSELFVIENAGHTFGGSHPWEKPFLANNMQQTVTKSIAFLKH